MFNSGTLIYICFIYPCLYFFYHQVMFIQNKGDVTMTIELLDTEEAQADDPLDVQVNKHVFSNYLNVCFSCRHF